MRWLPTVVALVWTLAALSANEVLTPTMPGDDFDAWANCSWLESTEIPAGRPRWNARDEIAALTRQQMAALLDDATRAPPGSDARKVADFRAATLDRASMDRLGLAPLAPLFARIDAVRDKDSLVRLLGQWTRADVDPVNLGVYDSAHWLGISVGPGVHGESTNVIYLLQGGLGMASRESYLDPDKQALRANYQNYLVHLLQLAGFERATQRAAAVARLEVALARTHATAQASAEERNADHLWNREDFARLAPGVDWPQFFDAAGLGNEKALVVWQPAAVIGGAALLRSQPLETWLDYLRLRVLDEHADVLPGVFAQAFTAFHGPADPDAWTTPVSGLIGRLYAERYFPAEQKARVSAIVRNVTAAFRRRVETVSWMTEPSKAVALAKIDAVYFGIGYPERWPDYSSLEVRADDPLGNRLRLAEWNHRAALARVGQPVDRRSWWITPQTAGAVLLFSQNAYNFAAALLQPPKYDAGASEAMNYGAIGAIVGHELSHFVDTLGADYEVSGRKFHWWTPADHAGYEAATTPLVQQFSNYSIASGEHVDGKLALVENVADLAGLSAAFDAYRSTLGERMHDAAFVRRQDREFFTGFARAWRSRYGDEALRNQMAGDHAPERFRIATVRNLDAWYQAFDVAPGQKLYLAPRERARVW
jgi:predicted metalloendopeptidase